MNFRTCEFQLAEFKRALQFEAFARKETDHYRPGSDAHERWTLRVGVGQHQAAEAQAKAIAYASR
jgi:hypothetical protein